MLRPRSRVEQVKSEILLTKATGRAFLRLASWYGFQRPAYVSETQWRKALLHVLYGARGTPQVIFAFLEAAFGEWIDQLGTFSGFATSPNVLEISGANANHTQRLIRVDGKLHFSTHLGNNPDEVVFASASTKQFEGASFSLGNKEVKILPFFVQEENCKYIIYLDGSVLGVPPTYLHHMAGSRNPGEPFGGALLDYFSSDTAERYGSQTTGPYPTYLGTDDLTFLFFDAIKDLLVAGIISKIKLRNWAPGSDPLFGSLYNKKIFGSASPTPPAIVNPSRS